MKVFYREPRPRTFVDAASGHTFDEEDTWHNDLYTLAILLCINVALWDWNGWIG